RAVRGFFAGADLSLVEADAPARDGGTLGGWRRRIVCRLYKAPLCAAHTVDAATGGASSGVRARPRRARSLGHVVSLGTGAEATLLWRRQNPEDGRDVARGAGRRLSQPCQCLGRSGGDRTWRQRAPGPDLRPRA